MKKKNIFVLLLLSLSILSMKALAIEINLSGSIVSDNQKMLTSRFMGYIKNMKVSEGDIVKQGDLLYEIDSKDIDAAKSQVELVISQAELSLQMSRSQYNNLLINLSRHQRLFKKGMVSKYELENLQLAEQNMKSMIDIAIKQVQQAQAKKQEVLNQYNYLKIKAPNDGVIVSKKANEGEMAIPGMPTLVLTDLSKLKIIVEISESNLKYISLQKEVDIIIPSIDFKSKGRISSIIPSSNMMTHKFKMKVDFDTNKTSIYPGMYAKVSIQADKF